MIYKVTLKKPWRSPRGKLYPKGTTFKFVKEFLETKSSLYDFSIPNETYGIVVFPNSVFSLPSLKERELKAARRKAHEDHMKKYQNKFITKSI